MTGGWGRRASSVLLATLIAVVGLTLVPGVARAAGPQPCVGDFDNTCVPHNTTSDNAYGASGSVSASGEHANPRASWTVLVSVSLPGPGLSVCSRGFNGSISNPPCYENQFAFTKWNHVEGAFETTWQGYAEVNGPSHEAALEASDYKVFLLRNSVQIYRTDGATVNQTYYGTYDRRSGAPAAAPSASFDYDIADGGTIEFHATSTDFYDRTMTHTWDFGDGTTGTGANPTHGYVNSGSYMVKLTTTNSVSMSDDYSRLVIASGHPLEITALSLDPASPVPLGDPLVAHVTVKNNGTKTISSITPTAELTPTSKVRQGDGTLASFTLAAGASHSFDVPIETLAQGEATIRVRTPGTVQGGGSTTAVAALGFDISGSAYAVTWSTDPARPRPGETFDLVAHVANNRGEDLKEVVPTLTVTPATGTTVSDPDPASIASLPEGESTDLTWTITSTQAALEAELELTGQDPDGDAVTGTATKSIAQHDLVVNETGDQAIDEDALADGRCDTDTDESVDNCTLRAAIQVANSRAGSSAISFEIPGAGVPRISPASALPATMHPVTIDGRTQTAGRVELHGPGAGTGLDLGGSGSTLSGLVVNGFVDGVRLGGEGHHRLLGNRIGTNTAGSAALANQRGVLIASHADTIGGTTGTSPSSCTGDCNLISGNSDWQVTNNLGLDPEPPRSTLGAGRRDRPGQLDRRELSRPHTARRWRARGPGRAGDRPARGTSLVIGGESPRAGTAPGNLVGSASDSGILLSVGQGVATGQEAPHISIAGNSVGLDPSGARANGSNAIYGIVVGNSGLPAANLVVGGANAAAGNSVGGVRTAVSAGVAEVRHNRIGTDVTGTRAVPNTEGLQMSNGGGAWDNQVSGNKTGVSGALVSLRKGNVVGLAADGRTALPNEVGVEVDSTGIIGADELVGAALSCAGPCNVISGNSKAGILVAAGGRHLGDPHRRHLRRYGLLRNTCSAQRHGHLRQHPLERR